MSIFGPSQTSIFNQVVTRAVRMTVLDLRASKRSSEILFVNKEALGIVSGRLQSFSFVLGMDIQKYQDSAMVRYFDELLRIDGIRNGRNGADLYGLSEALHSGRDKLFLIGWATGATEAEISNEDASFIAHGIYNLFCVDLELLSVMGKAVLKLNRELIISAYDNGDILLPTDKPTLNEIYVKYATNVNNAESLRIRRKVETAIKAAQDGDAEQQEFLGYAYFTGRGANKDISNGLYWYGRAAEGGRISSMRFLGHVYRDGVYVPRDYAKAIVWYKLAAKAGDAEAQENLAWCLEHGHGCECDTFAAAAWYMRSAKCGRAYSLMRLGAYFFDGGTVEKCSILAYGLLLYAKRVDASVRDVDAWIERVESSLNESDRSTGEAMSYDIEASGLARVLDATVPTEALAAEAYYDLD